MPLVKVADSIHSKSIDHSVVKSISLSHISAGNHYAHKETHSTYPSYHPLQLSPCTIPMSLSANAWLQSSSRKLALFASFK